MKKEDISQIVYKLKQVEWIPIIMAIALVGISISVYFAVKNDSQNTPKQKSTQEICEERGGVYISGGFWSLPEKCVFPPNK